LEPISHDKVWVQLFFHNLECLSNISAAHQHSAKEDGCGSQPW
jgi:hypothetical protein